MPDVYTQTSNSGLDQVAFNLAVDHALRAELYFAQVAQVRATRQSMPGSAVTFTIVNDLAEQVTPLAETVDPDAIAITDSPVTLTLQEYGAAVMNTQKLAGTSFVPFDPIKADVISRNAAVSIDRLASNALDAATQTIVQAAAIGARDLAKARAMLASASVPPWAGDKYVAFMHPDVAYDFMGATTTDGWLVPANFDGEKRWNGEIGTIDGVTVITTPRCPKAIGANPNYTTYVIGKDALAKAHSNTGGWGEMPQVVVRPPVDKLMRFFSLGWKWLGAFGVYRNASIVKITSKSTLSP